MQSRKLWAGLGAAAVLAGAAVAGPALAQDSNDTTTDTDQVTPRQQFVEDLADELGITADDLRDAFEAVRTQHFIDRLDGAVEAGRLTEEEAQRLRDAAEAGNLEDVLDEIRLEHLETRLQERVDAGELTQEQADSLLELHREGVLGGPGGPGGPGFGARHHGPRHGGPGFGPGPGPGPDGEGAGFGPGFGPGPVDDAV